MYIPKVNNSIRYVRR